MAPDDAAAGELQFRPGALNGVGVLDRQIRIFARECCNQRLAAFGVIQALRQPFDGLLIEHGYCSSATVLRRMPILADSTSTTSPGLSQRGGVNRAPAPVGVPVAIMSPGFRVAKVER